MASPLEPHTVRDALDGLDGWELVGDALENEFRFDGFRDAVGFVLQLAFLAEDADHHPEITNVYSTVGVRLTSHDSGGVTQRDIDMAGRIDELVRRLPGG